MGSTKIDFLFYSRDVEKTLTLDQVESLHVVKVLRKRQGDVIQVTDGKGGWFSCEITRPDPQSCRVNILSATYEYNRPGREIYIAIGRPKTVTGSNISLKKASK
ncbi:MAG: 16S rRNA (uracil(1498)-N(3))-methyltransferase [Leadbetterella sp.]|nr:16S rRNA (uracil(1498)-N(3))-methyltransferase [Leadbetterella sp.]